MLFTAVFVSDAYPSSPAEVAAKIAETMREYQGRYQYPNYDTADAVPWLPEACGEIAAPNYPPNDFYLSSIQEPNLQGDPNAVDLVKAIVSAFWDDSGGSPQYSI